MAADSARKIESTVMRALADGRQVAVSDATGITQTRLSRWKSADGGQGGGLHLSEVADVMEALGLAVIETAGETVTVAREEYEALRVLAMRALK